MNALDASVWMVQLVARLMVYSGTYGYMLHPSRHPNPVFTCFEPELLHTWSPLPRRLNVIPTQTERHFRSTGVRFHGSKSSQASGGKASA